MKRTSSIVKLQRETYRKEVFFRPSKDIEALCYSFEIKSEKNYGGRRVQVFKIPRAPEVYTFSIDFFKSFFSLKKI
jgi:hypothetical protein